MALPEPVWGSQPAWGGQPAWGSEHAGARAQSPEEGEVLESDQFEKLARFREEIVSGLHPRIKPAPPKQALNNSFAPSNATASNRSESRRLPSKGDRRQATSNMQSFQANSHVATQNVSLGFSGLGAQGGAANGIAMSENSIDTVQAELRAERRQLEQKLRDQYEQRSLEKATERPQRIDVRKVFTEAKALMQKPIPQAMNDVAANPSASSDSFDENSFYSSQHGTPDSHQLARIPAESDDDQMRDGSPYEPQLDLEPEPLPMSLAPTTIENPHPHPSIPPAPSQPMIPPGLGNYSTVPSQNSSGRALGPTAVNNVLQSAQLAMELESSQRSADASRSAESSSTDKDSSSASREVRGVGGRSLGQTVGRGQSPVVRAHNLSPIAPQPAHVSSLAYGRRPSLGQPEPGPPRQATPAQIASLRAARSAGSTPESSPQGNKSLERKKSKKQKKKRKADRLGEQSGDSPYIKPEPRSPSPISAQLYVRPNKRPRQEQQQSQNGVSYDEARYPGVITIDDSEEGPRQAQRYGDEVVYTGYRRREEPRVYQRVEPAAVARYDREYIEDRRQPQSSYLAQPASPIYLASRDQPREGRVVRTLSQTYIERPQMETTIYRDPRDRDRRESIDIGGRPGTGHGEPRSPILYQRHASVMLPPRAPTARILVDEYGREYLEPAPRAFTVIRESIAPGARIPDADLAYDRVVPSRAVARREEQYEDDAVLYRRPSSPRLAQRRVVTQPDLPPTEYRAYREREYVQRPMGPPGNEFIQTRRIDNGEDEMPREYITRAASVRLPPERYEVMGGYERRVVEDRPQDYMPVRSASVRPAAGVRYERPLEYERVDVVEAPVREYSSMRAASVRPAEPPRLSEAQPAREYRVASVRPEAQLRDYSMSVHPESRRDMMPPPPEPRAYSVRPVGMPPPPPQVTHREYSMQPAAEYYAAHDGQDRVYRDHAPQEYR